MITAHIATLPERIESLHRIIPAISPQVDRVYVMLNGHTEVPEFLQEFSNVEYELLDNSLGDAAKFLRIGVMSKLCVLLDDDLIPVHNFIEYLQCGLQKYGGAVSLHGRRYDNKPIKSFRKSFTANYRCLGNVDKDVRVHLLGTGCTLFDNTQIRIDQTVFEERNMADVLFSRLCTLRNIPMTVLAHRAGQFLSYIPQKDTIWRQTADDTVQTKILNTFIMNWGVL